MDVNATLSRIREIISDIGLADTYEDAASLGTDLAGAVGGLDDWLSRGGFLPQAWEPSATTTGAVVRARGV